MTKKQLNNQILSDMSRVIVVLSEIIAVKKLSQEDCQRIAYCQKLLQSARKTRLKIEK